MSLVVVVGKEAFTLRHLKVFRREELEAIFGELAPSIERELSRALLLLAPLAVRAQVCGREVLLAPGLTYVRGAALAVPGALTVPGLLDADFLEYLLFDLPRVLEEGRRAVLVEDLDDRFTQHEEQGIRYALDILSRVASAYRVPVVVFGGRASEEWRGYVKRIICTKEEGRVLCFVDGEKLCG
ncbi:MAG: hypothetical protein QXU72_07370 [Thermofilum sp.]